MISYTIDGFIYRIYPNKNNTAVLTLQNEEYQIEKEIGIYYKDSEKIVKIVKEANIFKKYNGFCIGELWLQIFSPKVLEFIYKNRIYYIDVIPEVLEKTLIIKCLDYETQRVFPKMLCKIRKK